jgi:N-acetylglutamate synthase
MIEDVRLLDSLCARSWPAAEHEEADGWILRATAGISLRANSVWPKRAAGGAALGGRIARAEAFYAARGLTPHFQISPASEPADLAGELERRGYGAHTTTDVMTAAVAGGTPGARVELLTAIDDDWQAVMIESAADPADARGRLAIADSIALPRRHALARVEGEAAAIGLGVLDQGWLGLFAMRTHPRFRRRGLASSIVGALLQWAAAEGARHAYLQVETDNPPAIALYSGLGFTRRYGYRYFSPLSGR